MKKNFFFLLLLVLSLSSVAQLCLVPKISYNCGFSPQCILSKDFNQDNKTDLIVSAATGTGLLFYPGNGNGTFGAAAGFNAGSFPISLASADFNGDGKPDLAVANMGSGNVSVLIGSGTGSFASPVNYFIGSSPVYVSSADFNNDTHPDLVVVSNNSVCILTGSSSGTFVPTVSYTVGSGLQSVTCDDFNNDGKIDLAVVDIIGLAAIFPGSGTGTFGTPTTFTGGTSCSYVASADLNNDGKKDLVIADFASLTTSVRLGTGTGNFSAATNYTTGGGVCSISIDDYNGDGLKDIVTANYSWFDVCALMNLGSGTFGAALNFTAGTQPVFSSSGDFNGDGKADIAVVSQGSDDVNIFLSGITPTLLTNVSHTTICSGSNLTLTAQGAFSYTWYPPYTPGFSAVVVSPTVNTSYTVTGKALGGCSSSLAVNVSINELPVINFSSASSTICAGEIFSSEAFGAVTFTWLPDEIVSSTFTTYPSASSVYSVVGMDQEGCMDTAMVSVIVNSCTGLKKGFSEEHTLKVFPNPSSGSFTLELGSEANIELYDLRGLLICSGKYTSGKADLNLARKDKGVYFLHAVTNNSNQTVKLIIE